VSNETGVLTPLTEAQAAPLLARLEAVEAALQAAFDAVRRIRREIHDLGRLRTFPAPLTPVGLADRLVLPALQVVPPAPSWVPILHSMTRLESTGPAGNFLPRPCGQVGLYLTEPPREHEKARLDRMRILVPGEDRWREPTPTDLPRCSSCGVTIDPFSNADLDYLSHLIPGGPRPPTPGKSRDRKRSGGEPPQTPSPGGVFEMTGSPSTFPGHTSSATQEVLSGIELLSELARSSGLLDDDDAPRSTQD
jgi:hypothetical protein